MILDDIVAKTKLEVEKAVLEKPLFRIERQASQTSRPRDFYKALSAPGLAVIAEVKRSSPSKGIIASEFDYVARARSYESGGASAISVLTEKHYFQGDKRYLTRIKELVDIPVLRKDFIISEYQVVETRAIGADALLLIAAILDDKTMRRLYELATDFGLHCLFEAHDPDEVKRVLDCGARIIGINNRNLKTFVVDLGTFEELCQYLPSGILTVAESGISSVSDARRMHSAGADAVLIGEALMRAGDPGAFIQQI